MPPRGYTIRRGRFTREMKRAGIANGNQLALRLGMHRSTVGEVLSGKALAGPAFTTAACHVFDLEHADLFSDAPRVKAKAA